MTLSDSLPVGDEDDFDPFAAGAIERTVASTEAQREVWLADRMGAQASLAYNESLTLRLRGVVDSAALIAAFDTLVVSGKDTLTLTGLPQTPAQAALDGPCRPPKRQKPS